MLNRPEWMEAALAVIKIGAVLVPINTRFRTEDVAYILDQSDSTTLILAERSGPVDYLGMVRELVPLGVAPAATRLPKLRRIVLLGDEPRPGTVAWTELMARRSRVEDAALAARADAVDPEDLAFFMYTSGTTGFPKGVMHSHRLVRNVVDRAFRLAITARDVIMMYLPLFHLFAFSEGLLTSMVTGARQVLTEWFDPAESLDLIERERATVLHGFDTHFKELLEAHERAPRDVSSVRTGIWPPACRAPRPSRAGRAQLFGPIRLRLRDERVRRRRHDRRRSTRPRSSAARPRAIPRRATRSGSSTPRRDATSPPGRPARSSCAATRSCAATTSSPRRPRPPSTPTAGCTPATWACFAPTATCASWAATRTC